MANGAAGTISVFAVDSSGGGLTEIPGSPFVLSSGGGPGTQGPGPNWIAIDPGERFLFVANLLSSNVGAYTLNANGGLVAVPGQPFNAGSSPSSVAFDKTGTYLYVANLRSNNVSAFLVNKQGIPFQLNGSPYGAGTAPAFLQLDPSGMFLYAGTQSAAAGSAKQMLSFVVNASSGQLTPLMGSDLDSTPTSVFVLP